jgi:phosphoglycolate phosphatase-like HAD superfamily hydrolase
VRAIEETTGRRVERSTFHDFIGRTDSAILRILLERIGIPHPEPALKECIVALFLRYLVEELDAGQKCLLLPGIGELLDALDEDPEFRTGLLTGNLEAGARLKLAKVGLDSRFAFGAFGSDDEDRDRLFAFARARAEAHEGCRIDAGRIVIVGDTPRDIRCARHGGAAVLAVATGLYDAATLASHQPDCLLDDLQDTTRVLAVLKELSDPDRRQPDATPRRGD